MYNQLLNKVLMDPSLDVMNVLNEVILQYPKAISFSSGRPYEEFFDLPQWTSEVGRFVEYRAKQRNVSKTQVEHELCQYGYTNGIINDLIANLMEKDEGVKVDASQIMVTNGCQEAMAICLEGMFEAATDTLLVTNPTYIGITGLATIRGIDVQCIESDEQGPTLDSIAQQVGQIRASGRVAKALYLIADFDNPTGTTITLERRKALLEYAHQESLFIIEDNPYGMFRFEGERIDSLFALDDHAMVIYLGTFAKTLCPGFRVGYMVTKREVEVDQQSVNMLQVLSKVKSLFTVNTGQYVQAVVGGILLGQGCSLKQFIAPLLHHYQDNRNTMLTSLEAEFGDNNPDISWNRPQGGFFITVDLPFVFDADGMKQCADEFGVICVPMSFFSLKPGYEQKLRLSFSYVEVEQVKVGIKQLGKFIRLKMAEQNA